MAVIKKKNHDQQQLGEEKDLYRLQLVHHRKKSGQKYQHRNLQAGTETSTAYWLSPYSFPSLIVVLDVFIWLL